MEKVQIENNIFGAKEHAIAFFLGEQKKGPLADDHQPKKNKIVIGQRTPSKKNIILYLLGKKKRMREDLLLEIKVKDVFAPFPLKKTCKNYY